MQKTLSNAELGVMDLLWRSDGPMTARQIREQLYSDANKAQHGTVQQLLQRLDEKGFLERDRTHNMHFFTARVSKQQYAAGQLETLADKLTAGSFAPLITTLVEQNRISADEIDRIREILDQFDDEEAIP